jgi:hypothetical protein
MSWVVSQSVMEEEGYKKKKRKENHLSGGLRFPIAHIKAVNLLAEDLPEYLYLAQ